MPQALSNNSLHRPEVAAVLDRLHADARLDKLRFVTKAPKMALLKLRGMTFNEIVSSGIMNDVYIPVSREQGRLLYLVARTLGARRIVEFGTSFGISTIYLAAAVKDNGGGTVIGSELEPNKQQAATANLAEAGLGAFADVRLGDALQTLSDVPPPVDMVLLDGWKETLRPYVEHMQSGQNGFQSVTLSISDGFEYSYYEGPGAGKTR